MGLEGARARISRTSRWLPGSFQPCRSRRTGYRFLFHGQPTDTHTQGHKTLTQSPAQRPQEGLCHIHIWCLMDEWAREGGKEKGKRGEGGTERGQKEGSREGRREEGRLFAHTSKLPLLNFFPLNTLASPPSSDQKPLWAVLLGCNSTWMVLLNFHSSPCEEGPVFTTFCRSGNWGLESFNNLPKQWKTLFSWAPKSLQTVTEAMKLKDACWVPKNWCLWIVVLEDSWESLGLQGDLTSQSKGNQSWIFIGKTDAEAETPILWPPDAKNWLIGKDPDAGKDWGGRRRGRQRMRWLDGITNSRKWVWASSMSWWWTG